MTFSIRLRYVRRLSSNKMKTPQQCDAILGNARMYCRSPSLEKRQLGMLNQKNHQASANGARKNSILRVEHFLIKNVTLFVDCPLICGNAVPEKQTDKDKRHTPRTTDDGRHTTEMKSVNDIFLLTKHQ